jgi:hypothetical protein
MPIENILALIRTEETRKANPIIDIDPEILQWAKLHAEIWIKRWKEGTEAHWEHNEERNNYIGLIGHKCFEVALQQMEIPYINNDPVIDWRGKKSYDLRIPHVGTLEIKTTDYPSNHKRMLIKCSEWHNSNYAFAIKLLDKNATRARFIGYATNEEVSKFNYAENEFPCLLKPCYWEFLNNLHPASEFFHLLCTNTKGCWNSNANRT